MSLPHHSQVINDLATLCRRGLSSDGLDRLPSQLNAILPDLQFRLALTRSGWCRPGGIVDAEHARVAENVRLWVERESAAGLDSLITRYAGRGYRVTRLQGRTHFLVAATGPAPEDFIQLEIEELQEVLDRSLVDPHWQPEDLEEFLDPFDYPRLEAEPIGPPRFVFRRMSSIAELIRERVELSFERAPIQRFFRDWRDSSAGEATRFCDHWVLALRETPDSEGGTYTSAKPVPTDPQLAAPAKPHDQVRGTELSKRIHALDQQTGYPFAWYFSMLCSRRVPFDVAEAVFEDLNHGFDYLAERDARVLRRWIGDRYAV